jgi:hypothetical protein
VISLTTNGNERWVYRYNGTGDFHDYAFSIDCGIDSNIYVSGSSSDSDNSDDFIVISLTPTGIKRWVFRYNTPANIAAEALSCVYGDDGNIYAAGYSYNLGTGLDFTVISLSEDGIERWVYWYNGTADTTDVAYSLVYGGDGNLYAAGISYGSGTDYDFTVISLNPAIGIEEQNPQRINKEFDLSIGTFQNQNLTYSLSLPDLANVSLFLYNLFGQKILSWQIPVTKGISHHVKNLPSLSPGVYFLRAETEKGYKENKKFIVVK